MKKKIFFGTVFLLLCTSLGLLVLHTDASNQLKEHFRSDPFPTFYDWKKACDILPRFNDRIRNPFKTIIEEENLTCQIDQFFKTMRNKLGQIDWIDKKQPSLTPTNIFQAYVEKLIIPDNSIVAIHGDFHGDVHAINRFIDTFAKQGFLDKDNPFKIKADNFYILFLGDYVDRGWYGAEVIYTILRLKNENPGRVFMTRGNHENMDLNAHYGFQNELQRKYSSYKLIEKIEAVYNFLPLALYVGAGNDNKYNFIQCCHGGIEIGFDPRTLLEHPADHAGIRLTSLMQKDGSKLLSSGFNSFVHYFSNNKIVDTTNGFMWTDFIVNPQKPISLSPRDGYSGSLFQYGKKATLELLQGWSGKYYTLRAIFRAHQHSDDDMYNRIFNYDKLGHSGDIGVGKLWIDNDIHRSKPALLNDIAVVTFSVAPETEYGWPYHSFGELHVASEFKDWRLRVYQKGLAQ